MGDGGGVGLFHFFGLDSVVKAIAEATDGADEERVSWIRFDLLAEAQDVDVDGAVGDGAIVAPNGIEQLLTTEDYTGAAHQEFEQPELGRGQGEKRAIEAGFAAAAIELKRGGLQDTRGAGLAAELNFDAGDELTHKERFDDIVISA